MLRNFLKVSCRNLLRYKRFALVNITGLALGITCCLLILLWVRDELSYDRFHANNKQLYWVMANRYAQTVETLETTPEPLARELKSQISGIQEVTQFVDWDTETVFIAGQKRAKERGGIFASASFFRVFSFPLLKGNPQTALTTPGSIVISQTLARKYFGEEDPINKTIQLYEKGSFMVTGVMQDFPANSSIQAEFVLPLPVLVQEYKWLVDWENFGVNTVALLHPDAAFSSVAAQITPMLSGKVTGQRVELLLQPFSEKYLYAIKAGKPSGGRIEYVRLFGLAAFFILIIACVNFTNLSTAQASKRAKEVGIRKAIGAERFGLITQFLGDALILTLLAFVLALLVLTGLLPVFSSLTGKTLHLDYRDPYLVAALLSAIPFTALMAGAYPAVYLASLEPYKVLKGILPGGRNTLWLRKGLVVFQFLLSVLLIVSAIVVHKQVNFIWTQNLGLDRQNVLYVNVEGRLGQHRDLFKQALLQSPSIVSVTTSARIPIHNEGSATGLEWLGMPPGGSLAVAPMSVDYDFIKTMNIKLKEGRDFSPDFPTDSFAYVINESAARAMGMKTPLGEMISFRRGKGTIIGIMKDFHLQSFHVPIRPLVLMLIPRNANHIFIRIREGQAKEAVTQVKAAFHTYNPDFPFEYHFLDELFEQQYKRETIIGQLSTWFACIATAVSCLGLFGLALFSVEARRKEIGIRKVLGAGAFQIGLLLAKEFVKLVLIANVVAIPLAWWSMNYWLSGFAYRTDIPWWIFVQTGAVALLIALLTVAFQIIRAAIEHPVTSLRIE